MEYVRSSDGTLYVRSGESGTVHKVGYLTPGGELVEAAPKMTKRERRRKRALVRAGVDGKP